MLPAQELAPAHCRLAARPAQRTRAGGAHGRFAEYGSPAARDLPARPQFAVRECRWLPRRDLLELPFAAAFDGIRQQHRRAFHWVPQINDRPVFGGLLFRVAFRPPEAGWSAQCGRRQEYRLASKRTHGRALAVVRLHFGSVPGELSVAPWRFTRRPEAPQRR